MTDKKKHSTLPRLNFETQEGLEPQLPPEYTGFVAPKVTMFQDVTEEPHKDPSPLDNPYWTEQPWKMGLMTLYRCRMCGTDRNEVDSIMEHILLHHPVTDQEDMLTKMLALSHKEK